MSFYRTILGDWEVKKEACRLDLRAYLEIGGSCSDLLPPFDPEWATCSGASATAPHLQAPTRAPTTSQHP